MIETTHTESLIEKHDTPATELNVKADFRNICLLLVLYTLQGVPLGLSLAIPIFIQNTKNTTFKEQAIFSFAVWPFGMKLLWAPLVDSLFIRKLGRRKSWLIPVQYFLGIFFFVTGFHINDWLIHSSKPHIRALTIVFFILNFLAATQDIIVDGWALTMLKRQNISYAAICNGTGQPFGIFLGYVIPLILVSETFWNKYWRTSPLPTGIITLQGFFYFWGVMYIIFTTLVAIFKSEKYYVPDPTDVNLNIVKTYKLLFSIIQLPSIRILAIILLTIKISFSSVDAAYKLKLIDSGVTKDEIAAIEFFFMPICISLPFLITRFTSKEKPLAHYFNTIPYRLLIGVLFTIVIYLTPYLLAQNETALILYKIILVSMYFLQQLVVNIMTLMAMSFYASISDPKIGGTNMTLLTTISNIGMALSKSGALWCIEVLTFKQCSNNPGNLCVSKEDQEVCSLSHGKCQIIVDGFYIETLACTIYGVIWYCIFRKFIKNLQSKNVKEWHVVMKKKEII